ncbi:MAG: hypothetical protein QOH26_1565 [Actinomycetota bacterium]|nr:hypothetical protein [Actinomycetota bacterium]
MKIESSVTSLSWIPSYAIKGLANVPFQLGLTHYDDPPPDVIESIDDLVAKDLFREANELRAWIEVEDGRIVDHGYSGRGHIGMTRVKLGPREVSIPAVALPLIREDPDVSRHCVTFVQTAGGRTALPAPRRVRHRPFAQMASSIAWTTLALTIYADGSHRHELVGASPFPRHWIYDDAGRLVAKSGLVDFKAWYRRSFGKHTPWGSENSAALVTEVETAVERQLSLQIMDGKPKKRKVAAGKTLVRQGDGGDKLFLVLNGVLAVEVDGQKVAEYGPGAILGERAALEGVPRTATLRAATDCTIAVTRGDEIARTELVGVAQHHGGAPA